MLNVDVGHMFSDEFDIAHQENLREDAVVMNDWMLKGFSKYKLDAANISYRDLRYGSVMFAKDKYDARIKETPMIDEMVSANLIPAKDLDKVNAPKPYIIREISGKRFGSKSSVKVGFIGLTQPGPGEKTGFVISEPLEKIKQVLPEVRAKVDIVVVLAYLPLELSRKMAQDNPGIDVIIAANAMPQPPTAQREGKTVIVYSVNQSKSLGELRLYLDAEGHISDYLNRYIVLDTAIPDMADAQKMIETSKSEIAAARAKVDAAEAKATGQPVAGAQPVPQVVAPVLPQTGQPQLQITQPPPIVKEAKPSH